MGYFFLGLAFLGAVIPYAFLGQFLATSGLDFNLLKVAAFASPVSSYLAIVTIISSAVTIFFIVGEGRRLKMQGLWLPILATFIIGVSCSLPLFLYLRKLNALKTATAEEPEAVPSKTTR
ncbi:MAG: DUF2834 domain-containing protein [Deltaproteobacteria bacterium]|jgi:hypothetical protein|nr:DUF2834 domain-containing protein [Deltaproteobacteria bacterium]